MTERARKLDASRLRVLPGGSPTPAPSYRLLTQVSAALSSSLDLDKTLREILERMNELVAFDAATLFLLDESRAELHVKAALGVPVALKEVKSFKVGEGVVGWVVRQGATALIQDSTKDARYKATGPERRAKTVLAVPLRAKENLLGALVLVRAAKEPFGPEHQKLVEAVASQAAVAIDHARLFETERASRRRAEALFATAQAGTEAVTMPEFLQRAVKQVAFAMRATAAAIILPDEAGEIIEAAFDAADPPAFGLESVHGRPLEALPLLAALEGAKRPILVHRAVRPALLDDAYWSHSEAQALAAVPVRWRDRLIAALIVGFADAERLTPAELELIDEIGRQIALGLERLRLQARVQEQQNEMAVVTERNRIARDMHDGLVQYVYALGLQLEHARDLATTEPTGVAPLLSGAIDKTNHVLSELRTLIYELRPVIMQEKEISDWLQQLGQQFQQATGIKVDVQVGSPAGRELSPELSMSLFRIVQEGLANVYKHAHATQASLTLDFAADGASLILEDNGKGFDVAGRSAPAIAHGHGLQNIHERIRELGASLELESAPGAGTRLSAVFPYAKRVSS
ncbi:MAG TPA: GAF domain-containing sensor histidine kinase [Candidatus Dormibacteraeota bacterium]|nr:GAF domain-containing sensor histidine kinase [Candidatus Dormibacteraeota bacterium]